MSSARRMTGPGSRRRRPPPTRVRRVRVGRLSAASGSAPAAFRRREGRPVSGVEGGSAVLGCSSLGFAGVRVLDERVLVVRVRVGGCSASASASGVDASGRGSEARAGVRRDRLLEDAGVAFGSSVRASPSASDWDSASPFVAGFVDRDRPRPPRRRRRRRAGLEPVSDVVVGPPFPPSPEAGGATSLAGAVRGFAACRRWPSPEEPSVGLVFASLGGADEVKVPVPPPPPPRPRPLLRRWRRGGAAEASGAEEVGSGPVPGPVVSSLTLLPFPVEPPRPA